VWTPVRDRHDHAISLLLCIFYFLFFIFIFFFPTDFRDDKGQASLGYSGWEALGME
jgi:hypothetical protein